MNISRDNKSRVSESMADDGKSIVMDDTQRNIVQWLREVGSELAELYEGSVKMIKDRTFLGRERLICHAVREIRNRLPDAVAGKHTVERLDYAEEVELITKAWERVGLESVYEKQHGKGGDEQEQRVPRGVLVLVDRLVRRHREVKGRKEENEKRLLIAFEPENEQLQGSLTPVVRKCIEVTDWFVKRAHIGKDISENELVTHFKTFEMVLEIFSGYFYEGFDEIEKHVEKANTSGEKPSSDEVVEIVTRLIRPKYRIYFFDKLENPHWIEPLKDAGFFKCLAEPKEGEAYERWPQGLYLKKMASKVAEEVLEIICTVKTRNPWVVNTCVEILLEMPEDVAAKGVKVIQTLLPRVERPSDWAWIWSGKKVAQLMVKLAEKQKDAAFEIAWVLLDAWVPKDKKGFRDIVAKFTDHDYRELVLKEYRKLWELEPRRAFWVLVKILNRCLKELDKESGYDVSSHFYAGLGLRDLDSIDVGYGGIETILVKGICEAGKTLIEKQPEKVSELLDGLEKLEGAIFARIEMYLLRFVGSGIERDRINKIIADKNYLGEPGYKYEYKRLLNDKFDEVEEARQVFENWVGGQKIDNMEDWEEWFRRVHEREPTAEDKAKYVAGMKARQLYLVKERYLKEYDKYKAESGLSDAQLVPRRMVSETRRVSPMEGTPISPEEMAKKKVDEVLEYILEPKNYAGKEEVSGWGTVEDALRATFKEDVKKRPIEYLKEGREKLANLPAGSLSGFFYGVFEAVRDGSFGKEGWGDLIELAHRLVQKKHIEECYRNCFSAMLNALHDGFSERENKIEFDEKTVRKFWEVIEPLVHFPIEDISGVREERDPVQLACNIVAGQALELTVLVNVVCKHEFTDLYEKYLTERRRRCYGYVLSEIRQPGVNCVFGLDFARLYWLDKEWVERKIESIFSNELWDETWGTYVSWGRPSPNGFKLLVEKGEYGRAVEQLGQANKFEFQKNPEEGLVEHLMIGFFNGWIELDDDLLQKFFENGNAELRGKSARFLATGFKSVNEEGGGEKEKVAGRMKEYWERRLAAIEKKPEENIDEAVEFTGWVKDTLLDAETTLGLLERTLDLTGDKLGRMRSARMFLEWVCKLGQGHELRALRCLRKSTVDENLRMVLTLREKGIVEFLEHILLLPNDYAEVEAIRREAVQAADAYGRIRPDVFRDVWERLRKTL